MTVVDTTATAAAEIFSKVKKGGKGLFRSKNKSRDDAAAVKEEEEVGAVQVECS
jgi:hypothetical protein